MYLPGSRPVNQPFVQRHLTEETGQDKGKRKTDDKNKKINNIPHRKTSNVGQGFSLANIKGSVGQTLRACPCMFQTGVCISEARLKPCPTFALYQIQMTPEIRNFYNLLLILSSPGYPGYNKQHSLYLLPFSTHAHKN